MKTGSQGTFVISWAQTETDGVGGAPPDMLSVGVTWRWSGTPVRVDGPQDLLVLVEAKGVREFHHRAARMVGRLINVRGFPPAEQPEPDLVQGFVVTDGHQTHVMTIVTAPGRILLTAEGAFPPPDRDLWVVRVSMNLGESAPAARRGMICFTPQTAVDTPTGPRLIQDLSQGDRVLTRDNGAQMVLWRGQRRISGARLHAMPHLRPIRIRQDAMGHGRPEHDLLVSPQHRMLVRDAAARALFNTDEVLVSAEDLINDRSVTVDYTLREVTYVHILLARHNIIWANGLETESFHPGSAELDPLQRAELAELLDDPQDYGDPARRSLSAAEAAILRHGSGDGPAGWSRI